MSETKQCLVYRTEPRNPPLSYINRYQDELKNASLQFKCEICEEELDSLGPKCEWCNSNHLYRDVAVFKIRGKHARSMLIILGRYHWRPRCYYQYIRSEINYSHFYDAVQLEAGYTIEEAQDWKYAKYEKAELKIIEMLLESYRPKEVYQDFREKWLRHHYCGKNYDNYMYHLYGDGPVRDIYDF